jgi:hypothetical protein
MQTILLNEPQYDYGPESRNRQGKSINFFATEKRTKSLKNKNWFKNSLSVLALVTIAMGYAKIEKNNYQSHFHQYAQSMSNQVLPQIEEKLPVHYLTKDGIYEIKANPEPYLDYLNTAFETKSGYNNIYLSSHVFLLMAPEVKIKPEIKEQLRLKMLSYGTSGLEAENTKIRQIDFRCLSLDILCHYYENRMKKILLESNEKPKEEIKEDLYNLSHKEQLDKYYQHTYLQRTNSQIPVYTPYEQMKMEQSQTRNESE